MYKEIFDNVKSSKPLIHCVTNDITNNDCANIILAIGGSPTMDDDYKSMEETSSIANALVLNMGTRLLDELVEAMILSGKKAMEKSRPIVLDPVAYGASSHRRDVANKLLDLLDFTVIKGNASEIKAMAKGSSSGKGVDVDEEDQINRENLEETIELAKDLARRKSTIVVISGPIDIVTDGETTYTVSNGHEIMSRITGSGCMLSCLIATFIGANKGRELEATCLALGTMSVAGELAYEKVLREEGGNSSFRNYLIDYVYLMDYGKLKKRMKLDRY